MTTGDDTRPGGRTSTPETLKLRAATRAFMLHLDELPVDYDEQVSPDRFLTAWAFMFARNRYGCADSMIGSGFGGTVIGAIARSVLVDSLRWLWIAQDPDRRTCILGDLLEERSRIASLLGSDSCPTLSRFLIPVPPVADLTGSSRTWLDAPSVPDEDALFDELPRRVGSARLGPGARRDARLAAAHPLIGCGSLSVCVPSEHRFEVWLQRGLPCP